MWVHRAKNDIETSPTAKNQHRYNIFVIIVNKTINNSLTFGFALILLNFLDDVTYGFKNKNKNITID